MWSEELAHWIADPSDADARDEATTWNGEPLSAGARLSDRDALARSMAARLGRDEIVLLTSNCDSISRALVAARTAGSRVRALVAQGGPLRDGHRIAHTLARSNIPVTMCSDAAILQSVADVDRVWLFTEAIGSDGFLAPIGTTKIIEEAERHGVPVELFATSDTLIPGGAVSIPDWPARERATLWPDLSATIEIQTFLHEIVAMDSIESIGTEVGRETAAALSLRALRLEAAAPCAPSRDRDPDDD